MKNPFGVKRATQEDEEPLFAFLCSLHDENGMAPMSEPKVRAMIERGTRNQGGIIGLIEGPKGIEASVGLILGCWWYTDKYHLEEMWTYVHPNYRKNNCTGDSHAKRLIEFAKWCSDEMSRSAGERIPLLMGILTKKRLEPKMRLYQRQSSQAGALFAWPPLEGAFNQRRLSDGKRSALRA